MHYKLLGLVGDCIKQHILRNRTKIYFGKYCGDGGGGGRENYVHECVTVSILKSQGGETKISQEEAHVPPAPCLALFLCLKPKNSGYQAPTFLPMGEWPRNEDRVHYSCGLPAAAQLVSTRTR